MRKPVTFNLEGEELIKKDVADAGSSGRVFCPKSWIGRKVAIILLPEEGKT
jgi:putative transposon-encoded protein